MQKKTSWRKHLFILGTIALMSAGPFLSMLLAVWIASAFNCQLDEGSAHPCIVAGRDVGSTLYNMAVAAWLGLVSVPLGFMVGVVYLAVLLLKRFQRRGVSRRR